VIKSLYDVKDIDSISRTIPKSASSVSKYRDEDVFLHVEGARVEREVAGPEAGDPKLGRGEKRGHEASDGEGGHLDGDLGDDEGLSAVGEELVEEGEEGAGEQAQGPHSECPYRE